MVRGEQALRSILLTVMFLFGLSTSVFGQHGSASNGYYPMGYSGDTWTGEVVSTDDTTREITLKYANEKKSETFTVLLKDNFQVQMKDGSTVSSAGQTGLTSRHACTSAAGTLRGSLTAAHFKLAPDC
jgi:hypothetical protein